MGFLGRLLRRGAKAKEKPTKAEAKAGLSITLWAADDQTAKQLSSDQCFLVGVLMADGSSGARQFLDGLNRGGSLSCNVAPNSAKEGYDVELTLSSR